MGFFFLNFLPKSVIFTNVLGSSDFFFLLRRKLISYNNKKIALYDINLESIKKIK